MIPTSSTPVASRERILTALACRQPDRVPFLESVVDEAVALSLLNRPLPPGLKGGEMGTEDSPAITGSLLGTERYQPLELVENMGLDGLGMYCFLKHGGIQEEVDGHYMVKGGSLKTRADLKRLLNAYPPPDPDDPAFYTPFESFIAENRPSGKALFCFLNLGSDPVILGMGFETFATAIYDDRSFVEDLFSLYSGWYAKIAQHLSQLDFDFLWFGDDLAFKTQPYVSPRIFRQLFLPHFRRVIEQTARPWIFHSDGNLMPILDDLLSLGMNGLHPIEPGAMDLGLLKKRYGQSLCLAGHISVDALSRGTPQEVDALVRAAIRSAAPGGGYICGSSNSIPYYAKPENVRAMQQAILKYGGG